MCCVASGLWDGGSLDRVLVPNLCVCLCLREILASKKDRFRHCSCF